MRGKGWKMPVLETSEGWRAARAAVAAHARGETEVIGWAASAVDPEGEADEEAVRALSKHAAGGDLHDQIEALKAREARSPAKERNEGSRGNTLRAPAIGSVWPGS